MRTERRMSGSARGDEKPSAVRRNWRSSPTLPFYASVEQRDNPDLMGKPIAAGGSRERGVVAAASYEARAFGVRSAMPSLTARRNCPDLIFVAPRFEVYKQVSVQVRAILAEYTSTIEPLRWMKPISASRKIIRASDQPRRLLDVSGLASGPRRV